MSRACRGKKRAGRQSSLKSKLVVSCQALAAWLYQWFKPSRRTWMDEAPLCSAAAVRLASSGIHTQRLWRGNGWKYFSVYNITSHTIPLRHSLGGQSWLNRDPQSCLSPSTLHDHILHSHCFIHLNSSQTVTSQEKERPALWRRHCSPCKVGGALWRGSEARICCYVCVCQSLLKITINVRYMWLFRVDSTDWRFLDIELYFLTSRASGDLVHFGRIEFWSQCSERTSRCLAFEDPIAVWPKYIVVEDLTRNIF